MAISLALLVGLLQLSCGYALSIRSPSLKTPAHTVDTGYAQYVGNFTAPYSVAYLGVPYAEPPVGDLRFRKPVPLDTNKLRKNKRVIDASTAPDFCIQGSTGSGDAGGAGSEDCLKVNIYAPANATSESNLPVLFYVHGGGFEYGNPLNFPFDHWINQSPNVVIVAVYYRLDSFGFLTHPAFVSDPSLGDLNAGIQDQIMALKWIQQNIRSFGGDPTRVTINGQSAGAESVLIHLIANGGKNKNLFSKAFAQSTDRRVTPQPAQQEPLFDFYAEKAGCGGLGKIQNTVACLRNASVSALARAQDAGANFNGSLYIMWRPVVDGTVISDYPTKLISEGKFVRVPVIAGATSNETGGGEPPLEDVLHPVFPLLDADDFAEINAIYNQSFFQTLFEWFRAGTGEPELRCGREIIGKAGVQHTKAWAYRYNQPNPTLNEPGITDHAAENWMMFDGSSTGFNGSVSFDGLDPVQTAFSQELIAYWLSFVRAGDPNTYKLARSPEWPSFSIDQRIVLQQDPNNSTVHSGIYAETEPEDEKARCAIIAARADHFQD